MPEYQLPLSEGSLIFGGIAGAYTELPGNVSTDRKFLLSVGDGEEAAFPAWAPVGIADVYGLELALGGKAASVHTHSLTDITGLTDALSGKAPSSHDHEIADVDGLQSALEGKATYGANTFTADQTISAAGSSAASPRTLLITANSGHYTRIGIAGTSNSIQGGNGQLTQFNSWFTLVLDGDRQQFVPGFMSEGTFPNVSTLIRSTRSVSRPLVVQGATSQAANLQEWWNSAGTSLASVAADGTLSVGRPVRHTSYTVGTLPTTGLTAGAVSYASNGRKSSEGSGSGTGVPVWYDGTKWRTYYDNSEVQA